MINNKIIKVLIPSIIVSLVIGFVGGRYWLIPTSKSLNIDSTLESSMSHLVSLDTDKGLLQIEFTKDAVNFQPYLDDIFRSISIGNSQYPKLFEQGVAKASFLSARVADNTPIKIEVANNEPDHGAYSPYYSLLVDPITGVIEENYHPRRDGTLSADDSDYLKQYPEVSEIIGNRSLSKLNRNAVTIEDKVLQAVVVIPITAVNGQELVIFDKNAVYLDLKGYEISYQVKGKTLEVKWLPDMVGIGDGIYKTETFTLYEQTNKLVTTP